MSFRNLTDFIAMGGYARYVWPVFAAAIFVFLWNGMIPLLRKRRLLISLRKFYESHP